MPSYPIRPGGGAAARWRRVRSRLSRNNYEEETRAAMSSAGAGCGLQTRSLCAAVMSAAPSAPVHHVVLEDDGEYFEEDPTVGRNVPRDPAGELAWAAMQPVEPSPEFLRVVQRSLAATKSAASPTS